MRQNKTRSANLIPTCSTRLSEVNHIYIFQNMNFLNCSLLFVLEMLFAFQVPMVLKRHAIASTNQKERSDESGLWSMYCNTCWNGRNSSSPLQLHESIRYEYLVLNILTSFAELINIFLLFYLYDCNIFRIDQFQAKRLEVRHVSSFDYELYR